MRQFDGAVRAADKEDSLIGALISNSQDRAKNVILEYGYVQSIDGIGPANIIDREMQVVPFASQVHTDIACLVGPSFFRFADNEIVREPRQKFFLARSVQFGYSAIVRKDAKLLRR